MTITPESLRAAFANVYFDGLDVGAIRNLKPGFEQAGITLLAGQTGQTEWDEIDNGMKVDITLEFEEINAENFKRAIPGAVEIGGTLLILSNIGASRRAAAKPLVIKPIIGGTETALEAEWFTFPLAAVASGQKIEITYNDGNQQIIPAIYKVFAQQQADGSFLFCYKGPAPV
jgi:hypothetical protein